MFPSGKLTAMHSRVSWCLQDMGLGGVGPSGCLVAGEVGVIPSGVLEMSECVPYFVLLGALQEGKSTQQPAL